MSSKGDVRDAFDMLDQAGGVYECGNNRGIAEGEIRRNCLFTTTYSNLMADGVSAILGPGPA